MSLAASHVQQPQGQPSEANVNQSASIERKIDNSQFEPMSHKKTTTLINYFILNTSQFLNSFANVSEKKIHEVDEKLDRLEQLVQIFEAKLDSLPAEAFEHPPPEDQPELDFEAGAQGNLAMTDAITQQQYLAPTENALVVAGANPKAPPPRAAPAKAAAGGGGAKGANGLPNALVLGPAPPPPPENPKFVVPPLPTKGIPKLPAGGGEVSAEVQAQIQATAEAQAASEPVDPDEAKREELRNDPVFAKFIRVIKMKVPLLQIRNQIRALGDGYDPDDILLFADKNAIMALKKIGDYTGTKYD